MKSELTHRWWGNNRSIVGLDEQGKRLFFRAGDLAARFWLNRVAEEQLNADNRDGMCILVHAEVYLADRLAYELEPWPKGMVKLETKEDYQLP
jgi:hypothetical protein